MNRRKNLSRLAPLVAGLTLPALAAAAPVINNVAFNPVAGLTITAIDAHDATISGITTGGVAGWSVSAEVCAAGFCGGGTGPQPTDPVLTLTNLDIHCTLVGVACPAFDLLFSASGVGFTPGSILSLTETVGGNVSGTGVYNGAFSATGFSAGPTAVITIGVVTGGDFNLGPVTHTTGAFATGFGGGGTLHINTLSAGSTLSLPGNFDITFADTPEPSTMALGVIGLLAFGGILLQKHRHTAAL